MYNPDFMARAINRNLFIKKPLTPENRLHYSNFALAKSSASFSRLIVQADTRYFSLQRFFCIRNKPYYIQIMARRDRETVRSASFLNTGLLTLLRLATLFSSGVQGYTYFSSRFITMKTYLFAGIRRTDLSNKIHSLRIQANNERQARAILARDYVLAFAGQINRTFDKKPLTPENRLHYSNFASAKSSASFDRLNLKAYNRYNSQQRYFYVCNNPFHIQIMTRRNGETARSASIFEAGLSTLLRLVTLFDSGEQGYKTYSKVITMKTYLFAGIRRTDLSNKIHSLRIQANNERQARAILARDYVLAFAGQINRTFAPIAVQGGAQCA